MRRRDFIKGIAGSAATWPPAVRAQQQTPVIGFVSGASPDTLGYLVNAFRQGLSDTGYVRAATSRSSFVGQRASTIGCRLSSPIWSSVA